MKTRILFVFFCAFLATTGLLAQVSINSDGTAPHASAMLEVKSTSQGLLVPRMTTSQRDGITNAQEGLLIYNTDVQKFQGYAAEPLPVQQNWSTSTGSGQNLGQSFQLSASGVVMAIEVEVVSNPTTGTLYLYNGLGCSSQILSQSVTLVTGKNFISLTNPPYLSAGNNFTFKFSTNAYLNITGNNYSFGTMFDPACNPSSSHDLNFTVYVFTTGWVDLSP